MPLSGPLSGAGLMELSWRDPVANIQIEKRQLALVPVDAVIVGTMKNALSGEIHLKGLPGWTATVRETSCTVDATDLSSLSVQFTGRPFYRLPMTLRPPRGQSFDVIVLLVGRDAVVALADGAILSPGRQIDIGGLRGAVAVSPRRTVLHLGARGSKSSSIKITSMANSPLGSSAARSVRRSPRCPTRMIWLRSISSEIRDRRSASAATATSSLGAMARWFAGFPIRLTLAPRQ